MRIINLLQPKRIAFGSGCALQCAEDALTLGCRRVWIVTSPPIVSLVEPLLHTLEKGGASVGLYAEVGSEPTTHMVQTAVEAARGAQPDAVIGFGGGSAMDLAKLVAALHNGQQTVRDVLGINFLTGRRTYLACLPTTSGTGSEVSPNAIVLDETDALKKGAISPHLVPDAAYVDPLLTLSLPPAITAATGIDALTHCIEVYANRFAHPMMDLLALEGIRLIGANLERAVINGDDEEARTHLARASLYGGLGLGPVNTAAVHALAYPLGGEFHVAHGLSNALLLPYVMERSLEAAPERYADVALALGAEPAPSALETARRGVQRIHELSARCGMASSLSKLGIAEDAIPHMAEAAMKVTRLLKNNLYALTQADAEEIYHKAY
jgi:alcohol dehydrogenase class IV